MQKLSRLQETVTQWNSIEQRSQDFLGLVELAIAESDPSLEETLTEEVHALSAELEKKEFELMFSEQYDMRNALITIHAGAGGVDSQTGHKCYYACTCDGLNKTPVRPLC